MLNIILNSPKYKNDRVELKVLKQGLGLLENLKPVNILTLGYSAEPEVDKDRHSQTRIPMDELVQYK